MSKKGKQGRYGIKEMRWAGKSEKILVLGSHTSGYSQKY
jgi:hypothetical protein